jgi:hypothetical protein
MKTSTSPQEDRRKKGDVPQERTQRGRSQRVKTQIPLSDNPIFKVKPVRTNVKTDASWLDGEPYREKQG